MGHVGLTPQSVHQFGGFRVQGKKDEEADQVLRDALAVQEGGAFSVVLEGIPASLGARITREIDIPTIGIGAGVECDGQVLVTQDMLNLFQDFTPKFVKVYADLWGASLEAMERYCQEVRDGTFPAEEHSF
jgi:3-methyl-2-oxobutanoate hydroxymethyltransferase